MHLQVRQQTLLMGLVLFVVALVLYWPTLGNDFVWDAEGTFRQDTSLHSMKNLFSGFSQQASLASVDDGERSTVLKYYRPFTKAFHVIQYQIFGPEPWGYNLTNIVFHGMVALLLFALVLSIHGNPPVAFFATLLFLVKPTHTEVVAWAYSDSYLLTAIFALATLLAFRHQRLIAALAAFTLAVLSHEMGVLLLPVLLLYAVLVERRTTRTGLAPLVPYVLVTIGFLVLRRFVVGPLPLPAVEPAAFANTAAFVFFKYLKIFLWPDAPVTIYLQTLYASPNAQVLAGYMLMALAAAVSWLLWRRDRSLLFWFLWFFVWSAVGYNIGRFGDYLMAEKIIYTASAGLCVLTVVLLHRLFATRTIPLYVAFCCVALIYAVNTWQRLPYWQNTKAYIVKALEHAPKFYNAWYTLAHVHIKEQQYDQALIALEQAAAQKDAFSPALNNIGNIHFLYGRLPQAVTYWQKALQGDPSNPQPYFNIGMALQKMGRTEEAIRHYELYLASAARPDRRARMRIDELRRALSSQSALER